MISFDIHALRKPLGTFTHEIYLVDEFTGYLTIVKSPGKSLQPVFSTIRDVIHQTYNANSHRVGALHGDPEPINRALAPSLGSMGVRLYVSTLMGSARRVERYTRTVSEHSAARLAELAFYPPPETEHYLHAAVAAQMNHCLSSKSSPLTPHEAFTGRRAPLTSVCPFWYLCTCPDARTQAPCAISSARHYLSSGWQRRAWRLHGSRPVIPGYTFHAS